jgi:hypothetical protein
VYTWPEIEEYLASHTSESAQQASAALDHAFRVEARQGESGSPRYRLFFDVRNSEARHSAAEVRALLLPLSNLVRRKLPVSLEVIEVCPVSATPPIEGPALPPAG